MHECPLISCRLRKLGVQTQKQVLEELGATFHFSPMDFNSLFLNISQFSQTFTYKGKMIESLLDSISWQKKKYLNTAYYL